MGAFGVKKHGKVKLFGAAYSVYVRAVRLALEEKGVPYERVEVDIFAAGGPPADYLARQPFGRIPAFEHEGFRLYEAGAIERYIDEAFDGPPLQPGEPKKRARMNQVIGILDSYVYRTLVWDIFVERVVRPREGRAGDETRIADALRRAETCLLALENVMQQGPWLAGAEFTLADCHAAPMLDYFQRTPEGAAMLAAHESLLRWWDRMAVRPSMLATRP
jgi:glutathione S-transferase